MSAHYGFTKDLTLVSFVPERIKPFFQFRQLRHDSLIHPVFEQPAMIEFYNEIRGMEALDGKSTVYSTS
jgi:hypothetical protein